MGFPIHWLDFLLQWTSNNLHLFVPWLLGAGLSDIDLCWNKQFFLYTFAPPQKKKISSDYRNMLDYWRADYWSFTVLFPNLINWETILNCTTNNNQLQCRYLEIITLYRLYNKMSSKYNWQTITLNSFLLQITAIHFLFGKACFEAHEYFILPTPTNNIRTMYLY